MNKKFLILIAFTIFGAVLPVAVFAFVQRATVLTYPASNVGANTAFLRGDVTNDGGCLELKLWFELGVEPQHYTIKTPVKESNQIGQFGITMNGLNSCATYYYRAVAENNSGRPGYGQEASFVTAGCPSLPVIVPSATPTSIIDTTAATRVSTGITAGLLNSILLPAGLALLLLWIFRSKILGFDKWTAERKSAVSEYRARKELEKRVRQAKDN